MTPQIGLIIVLIISAVIAFGNYKLIKSWSKVLKSSFGKFLKVSIVVISSLFVLGLLITAGILINDLWENRIKKQVEFGVRLFLKSGFEDYRNIYTILIRAGVFL